MSLIKEIVEYRVSSVLNGDRKMYGKKFLFDGHDETCWNSDQGMPQWIEISLKEPKAISKLKIQFQGGFAAKSFEIVPFNKNDSRTENETNTLEAEERTFHPLDINPTQEFCLRSPLTAQHFKLVFTSSFDFYGRITIYNLDIIENA